MKLTEPARMIVEAVKRLDKIIQTTPSDSVEPDDRLIDESLLQDKEEVSFVKTYTGLKAKIVMYSSRKDWVNYYEHVHQLAGNVAPFLDAVRINADDEKVKRNRLNICQRTLEVMCGHLDWRKLY